MRRTSLVQRSLAGGLACGLAAGPGAWAQPAPAVVEKVEVVGQRTLPEGSFLYYVSTHAGDAFDETLLRADFRRLWAAGFLDDLTLEVADGRRGKIVRFRVTERPRVRSVDYRGSKVLSATRIEERLAKEDAGLRPESFFDRGRSRKAENIIQRMLEEEGHLFGVVRREDKPLAGAGLQVSFLIEDGLRARLKAVDFTGNEIYGDGALKKRMKMKERGFWNLSWLTGKDVYAPAKWREDQRRLGEFYLDRGHVLAQVGEPTLTLEDGEIGLFKKTPVTWLTLEVPVSEGDPFRLGQLGFSGLTVFKPEEVRPLFGLQEGELYRDARVRKGQERLQDLYGRRGYVQATTRADRRPDPDRHLVDVDLAVDEDQRYYVGRVQFTGNHTTRDPVIRRQLLLQEGDVFNTEALRQSIRRINQLGYFRPLEAPQLSQNAAREDRLDVTLPLDEQGGNQFSLTASHSSATGAIFGASFMTRNLFGRGQSLQVEAERGERYHNYGLAVADPFFTGRPLSLALEVHQRWQDLGEAESVEAGRPAYTTDERVARVGAGYPLGRFTRLETGYGYSVTDLMAAPGTDPTLVDQGRRRESRFDLGLAYDTVDHPLTPHRGLRLGGNLGFVGGPLGGTVSYLEPRLRLTGWLPHTRRSALGLRAEVGWLYAFGDTAVVNPATGRNDLPFNRRYALGGETQIRGYDYQTVGPRDAAGNVIGGEKFLLGSAEYAVDVGGPFRLLAFVDAGQAYRQGQPFDLSDLRYSTGVELRFLVPVLNVPVRFIQAWNLNRGPYPKSRDFRFTFGTSF